MQQADTDIFYEVQKMRFKLKPSTRKNSKAFFANFENPSEEALAKDQYEQWLDAFAQVTEPVGDAEFARIDVDDFDIRVGQRAVQDFVAASMPIFAALPGI